MHVTLRCRNMQLLNYTILVRNTAYDDVPQRSSPYHTLLHHIVPYLIEPYHAMQYCSLPYCTARYYPPSAISYGIVICIVWRRYAMSYRKASHQKHKRLPGCYTHTAQAFQLYVCALRLIHTRTSGQIELQFEHIHTYTHAHIHTHTYTNIHTHTRIHAYTHTRIHAYTHTRICAYTHTRIHTSTDACMCACMHACIHASMHPYMHTHTLFCEVCGQRSSRSDEVYGAKSQKWAGIPSEDAEERERGEEEEGTERAGPSVSLPSRTVLRRRFIEGGRRSGAASIAVALPPLPGW